MNQINFSGIYFGLVRRCPIIEDYTRHVHDIPYDYSDVTRSLYRLKLPAISLFNSIFVAYNK